MHYPAYCMTDEMIKKLKSLNALFYSISYYPSPHTNEVCSIHFFDDNKVIDGCLNEVAYFSVDMHSWELGPLSGFNVISRKNAVDIFAIFKLELER